MLIIKVQHPTGLLYKGWCQLCDTEYAFGLDECDDIQNSYYGTNYILTCPSCNKKNTIYCDNGVKPALYVPPHLEISSMNTETVWCWFGDERKQIPCHYVVNEPNYPPSQIYSRYRKEPLPIDGYLFKESIEGWHAIFVGEHDH